MTLIDPSGGHCSATLYEASGLDCACLPGLLPVWPTRIAGPAFTVSGVGGDNLVLHHAVAQAPAGHVLVADVDGDSQHGHWGEILTVAAQQRGLLGLVIDGGVRDVSRLAARNFPVFASSVALLGTEKNFPGTLGQPIRLRGIRVSTEDLVVADADGVVVIPAAEVAGVISRADDRVRDEQAIIAALRSGRSTVELYGLQDSGS